MPIFLLPPTFYAMHELLNRFLHQIEVVQQHAALAQDGMRFMDAEKNVLRDLNALTNSGSVTRPLSLFRSED